MEELWNIMFTSRDFLRVEYNVLSENVTRDVSQSNRHYLKSYSKLLYSLKILFCSHMKDTLFPQERYFVHSIYYFVPTTYHLGTGIQKCGWVKQVFSDTILKGDHPRTTVTNIDSSWLGGFREEDLWMCFPRVAGVKLSSPLAVILDRTGTCQTQFWKDYCGQVWFQLSQ